nr:MAG TPA: hypothetical protein [Caudoviricetes sp.]
MERLTQRLRTGEVLMASDYEEKYTEQEWISVLQDRLAAYEDTGLTPAEIYSMCSEWCAMMSVLNSMGSYDRLHELAEADKEGRVVVLPCKVGDTVWMFEEDFGIVLPYTIDLISFVDKGCGYSANCNHNGELIDSIDFEDDDIGKTVFLTREEAEKALEAMKND